MVVVRGTTQTLARIIFCYKNAKVINIKFRIMSTEYVTEYVTFILNLLWVCQYIMEVMCYLDD